MTSIANEGKKKNLDCSYIAGGNIKRCSHAGKQFDSSSKKLNMQLPYDPASELLGIYPRKRKLTFTPKLLHECS